MGIEVSGGRFAAMGNTMTTSVARQIESLFVGGSVAGLSDRQLIERFVAGRDSLAAEAAFAALVARYGPMVLGVCRHLLGDHQHAEDAFQAVFLVLARRARSVRDPDLLGHWLYGVALRTARKARGRLARIRQTEEARAMSRPEARETVPTDRSAIERERAEALHAEVERLPASSRLPVVLCYFEGLSLAEAAQRLRCPAGTVHSRLVRAREKLRRGLLRRGVVLSGTAIAAALAPRSASASIPPLLCDSTARAAIAFAARHVAAGGGPSAPAAALAQEVLRTMLIHKLRLVMMTVPILAAIATGTGVLTRSLAMEEGPLRDPEAPAAQVAPRVADGPRPAGKVGNPDEGRMTVTGRVNLADGRPAAGVPVDIIAAPRMPKAAADAERDAFVVLGQGATDADGRFRIEAARASSARFSDVHALAGAAGPGTAFGCVSVHLDAEQPSAEVQLQTEQVIRGRLVDISGRPAAGVAVQVDTIYRPSSSPTGGRFDAPNLGQTAVLADSPGGLRAWPKPVVTDDQGRFHLTGVGRGLHVSLSVHDPRFAQQRFELETDDRAGPKEVSAALHPSTIIEGRVLAVDTGRPIPDAVISVGASRGLDGLKRAAERRERAATAMRMSMDLDGGMFTTRFRADGQGRFHVNPAAGDYFQMRAFPPEGQPYLPREARLAWTKGAVRKEIAFTMARGVVIRGKVVQERGRGLVAGASVQFFPTNRPGGIIHGFEAIVTSKDDGSFQVTVPAGKGYLMIMGPTLDYIPQEIGGGKLRSGDQTGARRFYAHEIIPYDVEAGEGPRGVTATLRPGRTVRGRVVGPAGETVQDAVILTRQQLDPINLNWQGHNFVHAHDGRFELPGFDPEKASPAYFLDAEHGWGATIELSGPQAGEELTVRLQPCGRAKARFVGPDGKPVAKLNLWECLHLLMTPGSTRHFFVDTNEPLEADEAFLPNVDDRRYPHDLATDADGRVILPALIPGAPHRIIDWSTGKIRKEGPQVRKEFAVKPGETFDLGDVLIEKPSG
jgi:RNA polymerase sigma factor (sigma-70 family)